MAGLTRKISMLERKDLEYEYLNMYDESTYLKTCINIQQDKIKKLVTKIIRLTSQQQKVTKKFFQPCKSSFNDGISLDVCGRIKELEYINKKLIAKLNCLKSQQKKCTIYKSYTKRTHVARSLTPRFTAHEHIIPLKQDEQRLSDEQLDVLPQIEKKDVESLQKTLLALQMELAIIKPENEKKICELEEKLAKLQTEKEDKINKEMNKNNLLNLQHLCDEYTQTETTDQLDIASTNNEDLLQEIENDKKRVAELESEVAHYKHKTDKLKDLLESAKLSELDGEHKKMLEEIKTNYLKDKKILEKEVSKWRIEYDVAFGVNKDLNDKLNKLQAELDALLVKYLAQIKNTSSVPVLADDTLHPIHLSTDLNLVVNVENETVKKTLLPELTKKNSSSRLNDELTKQRAIIEDNADKIMKEEHQPHDLKEKVDEIKLNKHILVKKSGITPSDVTETHVVQMDTVQLNTAPLYNKNLNNDINSPLYKCDCSADVIKPPCKDKKCISRKSFNSFATIRKSPKLNSSTFSLERYKMCDISSHKSRSSNSNKSTTTNSSLKTEKSKSTSTSLGQVYTNILEINTLDDDNLVFNVEEIKAALKNIVKELYTCKKLIRSDKEHVNKSRNFFKSHQKQ